ncbi:MAG: hypothetical protein JSU65_14745 [Candidatus Zixiibacteriota bacterium]|nr:MAG: hypothetical protein JSU65_14745 [candidate division Zixibacteria bacterium]
MTEQVTPRKTKKRSPWLIYLAALIAGLVLIADAVGYAPLQKITARLGLGLLFTALSLFISGGRPVGWIATGIVWIAVILALFW